MIHLQEFGSASELLTRLTLPWGDDITPAEMANVTRVDVVAERKRGGLDGSASSPPRCSDGESDGGLGRSPSVAKPQAEGRASACRTTPQQGRDEALRASPSEGGGAARRPSPGAAWSSRPYRETGGRGVNHR